MKDLQKIAKKCLQIVDDCGIEYGNIRRFEVNHRAKNRFGQCRRRNDEFGVYYTINISSFILGDETDEREVESTVIHEILHSCDGCMNHGEKWKGYANIVRKKYGYNIERTGSFEDFGLKKDDVVTFRYILRCTDCRNEFKRNRMSKVIQNPGRYRCGACGGMLERIK